jgi:hypothetical protein
MARTFFRKKFTNYLGEQRAIDDIVLIFTADIGPTPTPTPSITPSNTPTATIGLTPTPTPSITASPTPQVTSTPTSTGTPQVTSTPTQTITSTPTGTIPVTPTVTTTPTTTSTPTGTPNPLCPSELILSASSPNYLYGLYSRATIYTGGTFEAAWYNYDDNVMNFGTNPDGNEYIAYQINSGSDYTSLYWASDIMGNAGGWYIGYSTGNTAFNGGVILSAITLDNNTITDGVWFYPPSGFLQFNGGYIQYPSSCPTPTPTASLTPSPTPTYTPTNTPTLTQTPTPTEPAGFKLLAESGANLQTENSDDINIEH